MEEAVAFPQKEIEFQLPTSTSLTTQFSTSRPLQKKERVREEQYELQRRVGSEWKAVEEEEEFRQRLESITLPLGWQWCSNWKPSFNEKGADESGWVLIYRGERRRVWVRYREPIASVPSESSSSSKFLQQDNFIEQAIPAAVNSIKSAAFSTAFTSSADKMKSQMLSNPVVQQAMSAASTLSTSSFSSSMQQEPTDFKDLDAKREYLKKQIVSKLTEVMEMTNIVQSRSNLLGSRSDSEKFRDDTKIMINATRRNINEINSLFARLEGAEKFIRTSTGRPPLSSRIGQNDTSNEGKEDSLNNSFVQMNKAQPSAGIAAAKAERTKLNNDFTRTTDLFESSTREFITKAKMTPIQIQPAKKVSGLNISGVDNPETDRSVNEEGVFKTQQEMDEEVMAQVVQLDEARTNEALLAERDKEFKDIQKKAVTIQETMKDLRLLVDVQGDSIQTIKANTTEAHEKTKNAYQEIIKADEHQSNSNCSLQ